MSASNNSFVVKNGLTVNNNLLVANNGKVGVNTASPDAALTVVGSANVQGNLIVTANITAHTVFANLSGTFTGNVVANSVTASSNVSTNTVFATNVNATNINTSSANVTGNLRVGGLTTLIGNTTVGNSTVLSDLQVYGNLYITGATVSVGTSESSGDITPSTTETYRLGNSSFRWLETYTRTAVIGNSTSSATINSTSFSGTAANATLFAGQSLATVQGWITGNAATAYSNVTSWQFANATNGFGISGTAANANNLGGAPASNYINSTGSYTLTGAFTINNTLFVNGSIISVGNTTQNVSANTTTIRIGNSTVNATINSTTFSGRANDATNYTGTLTSGQVTTALGYTPYNSTNPSLLANSTNGFGISGTASNANNLGGTAASGYQTTAGLSANVATLTSNNTSFVGTVSAANVVSNAQLQANLGNYQTTAGLSANVAKLTANNTAFVGTVSAANVVSNAQLSANLSNYALKSGVTFTGQVNTSANVNVTGSGVFVGNGFGLTSTTYLSKSSLASDVTIFSGGDQNSWISGATFYPTLPSNISTLDIFVDTTLFITQVADNVANNSDLGYGGGNPQLAYRVVKSDGVTTTAIYTSEFSTLSTAGAGTAYLTSARDLTPIGGNSISYGIEYQWRSISSDPQANAGTLSTSNNTTLTVTGSSTYWQGSLNPRLEIAAPASSTTWVKIDAVLGSTKLTTTTALGNKSNVTYKVRDQYANVKMIQQELNLTFVGYK